MRGGGKARRRGGQDRLFLTPYEQHRCQPNVRDKSYPAQIAQLAKKESGRRVGDRFRRSVLAQFGGA